MFHNTYLHTVSAIVMLAYLSIPVWHRHIRLLVLQLPSTPGIEGGCVGAQEGPRDCLPSVWRPEQMMHITFYLTMNTLCVGQEGAWMM